MRVFGHASEFQHAHPGAVAQVSLGTKQERFGDPGHQPGLAGSETSGAHERQCLVPIPVLHKGAAGGQGS